MNNHLSDAFAKSYKVISALMGEFDAVCAYANGTTFNSEPAIADDAPKHFCDRDDVSTQTEAEHTDTTQTEAEHTDAPSLTLVNEKSDEPVAHKLSADEYLRQRNPQH